MTTSIANRFRAQYKGMKQKQVWDIWKKNPELCFLKDEEYQPFLIDKESFKEIMLDPHSKKCFHEPILPNKSCRRLVDIERTRRDEETEEEFKEICKEYLIGIIRDIAEKDEQTYGKQKKTMTTTTGKSEHNLIVCNSSKYPNKFSVHLVYPNHWFANSAELRRYMSSIIDKYPKGLIDNFYSEFGIKNLRLPYCWKSDIDTRRLIPESIEGICEVDERHRECVDWDFFLSMCMSCTIATPPETELLYYPPNSNERKKLKLSAAGEEDDKDDDDEEEDKDESPEDIKLKRLKFGKQRVITYFKCINGHFSTHKSTVPDSDNHSWDCQISPSPFCPFRATEKNNGFHKTQSARIGSTGTRVYCQCMDAECNKRYYPIENFGPLLAGRKNVTL